MRFKAKIAKDCLYHLASLVTALEKLAPSSCVIFLSEEEMRISVTAIGPDDIQAFAELKFKEVFHNYRLEGLHGNQLLFEIDVSLLGSALSSARSANAHETQMKLGKRNGNLPHLIVETRMSAMEMDVSQDIPVKLMSADEAQYYLPPNLPTPHVQLELPAQRSVRAVVDRMRGIDKYIYLDASMRGQLVLRVEAESATIKTYLTQLTPRFESMSGGAGKHQDNEVTLKVDSKKLASMLQFYNMSFDGAVACFVEDMSLVLHVFLPGVAGSVTFYQPVMHSLGDE